jgi:hypothetical protein
MIYWIISFKSTEGVTRDPFYLFDNSTPAEFGVTAPKFRHFPPKISFLRLSGNFGLGVMLGRFDRGLRDA